MVGNDSGRFLRQMLVEGIGEQGQSAIAQARVVVVGCGALGSVIASFLVRAGVGHVTLVDPDRVESSNLHRQILFDESDAAAGRAKVDAARARLANVHSTVRIEAIVGRFDAGNADGLIGEADVVVDGTDNFTTRYEINDACVRLGKPWIYGGVVGATGMSMTVIPRRTACLRCVFPEAPAPGVGRSPERDGVYGPIVGVIGSMEAAEALKLIVGAQPARGVAHVDLWEGGMARLDVGGPRSDCTACGLLAAHGQAHLRGA